MCQTQEPLTITYHKGNWSSVNRSLSKAGSDVAYALGMQPPHYHVPTIMEDAMLASAVQDWDCEHWYWNVEREHGEISLKELEIALHISIDGF